MGDEPMDALMAVIDQIQADRITFAASGNVSVRDPQHPDRFWITPSGVAWPHITHDDLVVLSVETGTVLDGRLRPSTEWRFHRTLYARHDWIGGVVHLHSRYATIFSTLGEPIKPVHYQMARVAYEVPVVPYETYGTSALAEAVGTVIDKDCQAALLANHGLVAVGDTVAKAYQYAQEIEWMADIYYHARLLGTPRILTVEEIAKVRAQFAQYGQTP
ncbi:MAG: class II aldolase/adducin family protein [Sulfobacillus sp.]|nr:class II aldolase/adducin family protein [Sulfobacillus sp.]